MKDKKNSIYTIGHSNRSIEQFIEILKHYNITHIIDIRRIPKSRNNPQFAQKTLKKYLKRAHIDYTHLDKLGGFRKPHKNSINTAWKNLSFQGFADYMQTEEFKEGLQKLIEYASHDQVAIMCAEAVPWRCHRSLIGDALLAKGIKVQDIFSLTSCKLHTLTPWAKISGDEVTYPKK